MKPDMWSYHAESSVDESVSLAGYDVAAIDGRIGSVDEATYEIGGSYLVIDTGGWIFGRRVMLPAGTIERIDHQQRKVLVARTRDEIKQRPSSTSGSCRIRTTGTGLATTTVGRPRSVIRSSNRAIRARSPARLRPATLDSHTALAPAALIPW